LLDEFEKADPTILNLFLQIFESGRLADSTGRSVDLTNVIIIATSDVGGPYVQEALVKGWDINRIKINLLEQELCPIYTPKLLDSFDGVIAFKSLTQPEIERITEMLIDEIARKLQDKEIDLRVEDEIIADLAGRGYDVRLGARTMRRLIQDEVGSVIDNQLLEGNVSRRDTIVLTKDGVLIEKAQRV
jgi:ATP-dependent Clp protease ATP-binding subunit ClpA